MPASQTVDYGGHGYLQVDIEPKSEPESVYFTDQTPIFEITIENLTNRNIEGMDGRPPIGWVLGVGPSLEETIAHGGINCALGPGETQTTEIEPGLLAYEKNAVLGLARLNGMSGDHDRGGDPIEMKAGPRGRIDQILYTFTIWDRSHYEAIHEQPKKLQKWVVVFGALTAILATIQVGEILLGML